MTSRMSKKTRLVLIVVIVAIGAVVGITLSRNSESPSESTLPVMTWNETSLSTLEGTPVVLNFWSIGCPACRQQLHYLEAVAQQSNGEIEVIVVNIADTASRIQSFFDDYEPTMVVALDKDGEIFASYCREYENPGYIPFTLFVDSEGVIQHKQVGASSSEDALWNTLHDVFGTAIP
jgi:thiol-disulfide isomerase/thioredoxin